MANTDALAESQAVVRLVQGIVGRMEPEARERIFGEVMRDVSRELEDVLRDVNFTPRDLRDLLRQPMAVGLGRPDFFDNNLLPSFGVAVHAGGDRRARVQELMQTFEQQMVTSPSLSVEDFPVGNINARRIQHRSSTGSIVHGMVGENGLLTNSEGMFAACAHHGAARVAVQARPTPRSSPRASSTPKCWSPCCPSCRRSCLMGSKIFRRCWASRASTACIWNRRSTARARTTACTSGLAAIRTACSRS